jgi:hypothetical protein
VAAAAGVAARLRALTCKEKKKKKKRKKRDGGRKRVKETGRRRWSAVVYLSYSIVSWSIIFHLLACLKIINHRLSIKESMNMIPPIRSKARGQIGLAHDEGRDGPSYFFPRREAGILFRPFRHVGRLDGYHRPVEALNLC